MTTGDEPLDFTTPGSEATAAATCAGCKRTITDQYWSAGGAVLCAGCRAAIEEGQQVAPDVMSRAARFGRAVMFGFGAMLIGSAIWYGVAKLLKLEIGLIAILLGFMVGRAVFLGSGNRGGRRYQLLAVFLTYLGIGVAYAPFAIEAMRDRAVASADSPGTAVPSADGAPPVTSPPAEALTAEEEATESRRLDSLLTAAERPATPAPIRPNPFVVAGVVLAGVLALPVIVTVGGLPGSLIGLLIYGFAIFQAWRMTAAHRVSFEGPFQIGAGTPA
jgi:hypothetical protein